MKKSEIGVLVYSGRCKPRKLANHHPLETETRMHLVVVGHQSHICNFFVMWDTVHKTHHKYSHFQLFLDRGVTLVACPSSLSCSAPPVLFHKHVCASSCSCPLPSSLHQEELICLVPWHSLLALINQGVTLPLAKTTFEAFLFLFHLII